MKRVVKKLQQYSWVDGYRKILSVILNYLKGIGSFCRKLRFYFYTKCWIKNILGKINVRSICNNMQMGDETTIYGANVFELSENARLVIGKNFTLSYGAIIACHYSVKIGDFVMIGEYSSIRDTTHKHENSAIPYCKQGDISTEIIIGNNVWIGRGCLIQPGTVIEDGVIVGAHSVVRGQLRAYSLYAGTPAVFIKSLKETKE